MALVAMLNILTTMRIHNHHSYAERMDAIDQRWQHLFSECCFHMILVPNLLSAAKSIVAKNDFDGVLLTGGNSLVKYGGDAQERDEVERFLISHCIAHSKPVVGVCRGMQMIQDFFGIGLIRVENHINEKHRLVIQKGFSRFNDLLNSLETVNSFHSWGAYEGNKELKAVAKSEDNVVMAIEHSDHPIFGHMWHPERNSPFIKAELEILQTAFKHRNRLSARNSEAASL